MIKCSIPSGAALLCLLCTLSLSALHLQTSTIIKLSDNVKIITNCGQEITLDGNLNGKSRTEILLFCVFVIYRTLKFKRGSSEAGGT